MTMLEKVDKIFNTCILILVIIASQTTLVAAQTGCTDAGVVVVVSVFATLAVVFIVLAIIGFLIWRRRKDILKPEKLKSDITDDRKDASKFEYTNPAFDVESGEGVTGHEYKSGKNAYNYGPDRDLAKKTWSSLPPSDLPDVRQRKSSLGSLDKFIPDNNREEVWLTSQDFIGLGFNIAGSMRDGIFVSQVHNRGPANESGKFQVGDRIMNVDISFENMVYEDALTILSYASPYPVKVTLQKQQTMPKNRKLSDVRTNLNHPLYRSHSVDILDIQSQEKPFYPKRAASEMRYCQKNLSKNKLQNRSGQESVIAEELGVYSGSFENEVFEEPAPKTNAVVHRVVSDDKESVSADKDVSNGIESNTPTSKIDVNTLNSENKLSDPSASYSQSQFIDPFETLTEQDKIDMLRLSYTDPDAMVNFDKEQKSLDDTVDFKSVPVKPERKKKRSSTSSTPLQSDSEPQGSLPSSPVSSSVVDEVFRSELKPPTEAPPPIPDQENEAEENLVLPETKTRNFTISSNSIVFNPRSETSDAVKDESTTELDDSLEDIFVPDQKGVETNKPQDISELSPVDEQFITATHISKEASVPSISNIFSPNAGTEECKTDSVSTLPISNLNDDTNKINTDELTESSNSLQQNDNSTTELFDNLCLDMDSVMFKDPFTNKSAKEKENSYAYDISVTELEAMEQAFRDEERKKDERRHKKGGGIAFEIRDDFVTGELRTVDHLNIHRTASYDTCLVSDRTSERDIFSQRPTSLKGERKSGHENDNGVLDWSGKRLVRSDSFTEIPQGDTVKRWTDEKHLKADDALIEKHIQEDSMSTNLKKLTKATLVPAVKTSKKDMENFSDSDSNCQSISSSCSSGNDASPVNSLLDITNIKHVDDDGVFPAKSDCEQKSSLNSGNIISGMSTENDKGYTVTLNTAGDEEEDC